jgi:hypothetical protein
LMIGNLTILSALSNPTMLLNPGSFIPQLWKFIVSVFIAWLVGAIVASLGAAATFLKYSAELCAGEVRARTATEQFVSRPSVTVEPRTVLGLKTCHSCGYANTASYCRHCGAELRRLTDPT